MTTPPTFFGFPPDALKFFRELAKHNDRDWFTPRKEMYKELVHGPMVALVEQVNGGLAKFAVEHVAEPRKALYRIYRDTRFSNDKTPYKLHQAAMFGHCRLPKNYCAGFYFHVGATGCEVAAGLYMPEPEQLKAVRRRIVEKPAAFEKMVTEKVLVKLFGPLQGATTARVPKDFKDEALPDAVMARVRMKQFYFDTSLPAEAALEKTFAKELLKRFEAAAGFVRYLNELILPLADGAEEDAPQRPVPMF